MPDASLNLIQSPPEWRVIDFISDLHLSVAEPQTFAAWQQYMAQTSASALFILGDLFEVWVGDDMAQAAEGSFEATCLAHLHRTAQRIPVFFIHGNRDFLVGTDFAQRSGLQLLADPCVLITGAQRWLLSHGDELCTRDLDYQKFRKEVRSPAWQGQFLVRPLTQRRDIARQLRTQSDVKKHTSKASKDFDYADVDPVAALAWLVQHQCTDLIHGHTHRPGTVQLDATHRRHVLSDWDCHAQPARADVFRLARPDVSPEFEVSRLKPALV